jgi:glycine/D-amino acid oxidase-like deaminating enzyme
MDLLSSRPFWPARDGLPATFPPLTSHVTCDVAIIGGGITGALVAWFLSSAGMTVTVLDQREVAHGSTAANTGLVLYELDEMLHRLAGRFGRARAERVYVRCCQALGTLGRLVQELHLKCEFARRQSLYVAAIPAHVPRLRREFEARRGAGLKVEWWPRSQLAAESTLPHSAAILSHDAAELDAYALTYGLLGAARDAGAAIHDRTAVTRRTYRRSGVELETSRGARVRARVLVVATGYEIQAGMKDRFGALHSTFALVSEPLPDGKFDGWPANRSLIWDTGNPYLYLRTTADNRAIIGGYDERFHGSRARDRMLNTKTGLLKRRFRQLFPRIPLEVSTAWAGTFGVSQDGLPLIGQHPKVPHTWFALGFGGNGITFSVIAAEIIQAVLAGGRDPDASLFGFERLT